VYARFIDGFRRFAGRDVLSGDHLTILLAGVVGLVTGVGAAFFGTLIEFFTDHTFGLAAETRLDPAASWWLWTLVIVISPPIGMLVVAWVTRTFAPEAMGLGVPEVIAAVARHDGVIRARAAVVKTLASGISIGMGGSVGREGPIVQIGSAVGSAAGQLMRLSAKTSRSSSPPAPRRALARRSTPRSPGSFLPARSSSDRSPSSRSLQSSWLASSPTWCSSTSASTASTRRLGTSSSSSPAWAQLPSYLLLGLVAGLAAAGFIKVLYGLQDVTEKWIPDWRKRALALGAIVGLVGAFYPVPPPASSKDAQAESLMRLPPTMGVGYPVVDHALHLTIEGHEKPSNAEEFAFFKGLFRTAPEQAVVVPQDRL
jgi:CIC family chloride channel protein